jgi:hypothetical protein
MPRPRPADGKTAMPAQHHDLVLSNSVRTWIICELPEATSVATTVFSTDLLKFDFLAHYRQIPKIKYAKIGKFLIPY